MAQGEFTGLTREKRDKLRRDLENLFNKKIQHRKLTGRDLSLTELSKINNEIRKIETQLGIDPSAQSVPSLRDTATGLSLSRYRDPMGDMGEPDNQNFKRPTTSSKSPTRIPSRQKDKSRVKRESSTGGTPTDNELLKRQALDRLKNPKFGYKQFGGLGAGDDSFEDEPRQTDRSRFKSRLSSPSNQRVEELTANARVNREANLKNVDDDQDMNALEKLVSRIVGRNIRFEDIPEDDPFITDMPQNYQNLRRGGQVKRMGHGGAITPEQKKRISRIVQENKARKSKSTKATPTATTSKKRAAPFSDMKKARMNGNKKRTNR